MDSGLTDDDLRSPAFFLSYARAEAPQRGAFAKRDFNLQAKQLFADLTEDLAQLLPLPTGQDPGYMDVDMETGQTWRDDLLHKLGSCRVFVALINESYLRKSEWCAREWHLFSQRSVTKVPGRLVHGSSPTAILPIRWAPIIGEMPKVVGDVQFFSPAGISDSCEAVYLKDGLYGMIKSKHEAYIPTVWAIAQEIQNMWAAYVVEPKLDLDPESVPGSFAGGAA